MGPLAATTEYDEPPGPPAPADASEADLAALQEKAWASANLAVAGIRVQGIKGRVPGYGSCSFRVEFTPKVPGKSASYYVQSCFGSRNVSHHKLSFSAPHWTARSAKPISPST